MPIKLKAIARDATEEAPAASLRQAIAAQVTEELTRAFGEPPIKDEFARVVREAVADALASIDWGNGRPGFSRK